MPVEATLIKTVGSSENRSDAIIVIARATRLAGLSVTNTGAITEMRTHPGTLAKVI